MAAVACQTSLTAKLPDSVFDFAPPESVTYTWNAKSPTVVVFTLKLKSNGPDLNPETPGAGLVEVEIWLPDEVNTVTVKVDTLPSESTKSTEPARGTVPPPLFKPTEAED